MAAGTNQAALELAEDGPPTLGADLGLALAKLQTPTFVLDRAGVLRWMNPTAVDVLGDHRGQAYESIFAPEAQPAVRREFTKKMLGSIRASDISSILRQRNGADVPVEIHCVSLDADEQIVGVLAIVHVVEQDEPPLQLARPLTPRQHEVLMALARGASTSEIAESLHLSRETVRNHVRDVLRALGAHSRLEAVADARRRKLVD